jgi:signal-transduction protein with cAMP-binding, CBS, and nucleotidyltransferase domain
MVVVEEIDRLFWKNGEVLTIRADETAAEAARKMNAHGVGCLVVVNRRNRVCGILSERDLLRKVIAVSANPAAVTAEDVMTRPVVSCALGTDIDQAEQIMAKHRIRHLPVIEDGVAVGMISSRDIMAKRLQAARAVASSQSRILQHLEGLYPGITSLQVDPTGRVII